MLTRRTTLTLGAAAAATTLIRPTIGGAAAPLTRPDLPYDLGALAPHISERTMTLHAAKHHQGYFDTLNRLVDGTDYAGGTLEEVYTTAVQRGDRSIANNAGQAWNHILYFNQFDGGFQAPDGALAESINRSFGGVDALNEELIAAAGNVFGSGWVWLVAEGEALSIVGIEDGDNPLPDGGTVLMGLDIWEHAYYLDYENRSTEHLTAVLENLVNWRTVGERFS